MALLPSIFLIFALLGKIIAQNHYVVAPRSLRLNADEVISVAFDGKSRGPVDIYIQDYPGKAKNVSETRVILDPGKPQLLKIRLDAEKFPSTFLSSPGNPKYVYLNAHFQDHHKEFMIPINSQYGYMFIQTDKPIYKPKDRVLFRIIPLNEDSLPLQETLQLQIRNPQNSIVEQKVFDGKRNAGLGKAFVPHVYQLPTFTMLGEWSATVQYGYDLKQNSTVHFQLQEYVLPTFAVKLETPEIILPTDEIINIKVTAQYVYGKKLQGVVHFRLGVKGHANNETTFFSIVGPVQLVDGSFNLRINTISLMANEKVGWFPQIRNSSLVVEARVVDAATGKEEEVVDSKCLFTDTPFHISFKRCLEDFRPGHTSVIEADIIYPNGQPAEGISTLIQAVAHNKQPIETKQNHTISDKDGKVSFEVRPQLYHRIINITLMAADGKYFTDANFIQYAFRSTTSSYIALDRMSSPRLKPGDNFKRIIHYEPAGLNNIYYVVISKGRIVMTNKLPEGKYGDQHVSFDITYEMVPSFRILVFAHEDKQLLVDSLKIDVESVCNPNAEISIHPEYNIQEPGHAGKIIIRGNTRGTFVGLIGVDEAVYALSKKDILTKSRIFKRLASHDLGCGAGGGLTVDDVLSKAGIILGSNSYSYPYLLSCAESSRSRSRRAVRTNIADMYNGIEKDCCNLGLENDIHFRSCQERATFVEHYLKDQEYFNCSKVFLDCCLHAERHILEIPMSFMTRGKIFEDNVGLTEIDPELEKDIESTLTQRTFFPETWIFEDLIIGPDNKEEINATLPHSITTWVIQAVSVSPTYGICVAEPEKITTFQKIFLQLNLPYSVVRNEQVEIQATLFNYDERPIRAIVYMYGAEGLCSSTQPGQKSERQHVTVDGQSAATVIFPVLPLKAEVIPIKVVAMTALGSDSITGTLNVIPEGITKEINIPITLDPGNLQNRRKRQIQYTPLLTDYIDDTANVQATTVKIDLCLPENFVPGTESCTVTAIGDIFGPAVQTAIINPEGLLQKPYGCSEQNMMRLAPTLYAMRYLKVTGKLTPDIEDMGYQYMRLGYSNQLSRKRDDGTYAAYQGRDTNTWLTAFVMKVYCQATELIFIDECDICRGITWLIDNQQLDGSFIENNALYESSLMGGINGKVPMTAFVLIALQECNCNQENERLNRARHRAVAFLNKYIGTVTQPLPQAIVAYALSLSGSDLMSAANDELLAMAEYVEDSNRLFWTTDGGAHDIQTAGYALLTQLLLNDMQKSTSIVNWLNTKQLKSGAFESTQDTMIALQAMSEYAIKARVPPVNLVSRISSSNDAFSEREIILNDQNAQILQDVKINKVGGTLLINTKGEGTGSLSVNLRYNIIVPPEDMCKFDITVDVTDTKHEEIMSDMRNELNSGKDVSESESRCSRKLKYKISICVRYLGDKDTGMSIVDVEIFSGFAPVMGDLNKIQNDKSQLIQMFELTKRGVIFYLSKIPYSDKYCFSFQVHREYIVGNIQMNYIKVYDYYNSSATCIKSYKPISNSPIIRTICEGGICQCAEGGCPPKKPFSEIANMEISERRQSLKNKFCDDFDYVWKGRLHYIRTEGGFLNISFLITEVIKEGIERLEDIQGEVRVFLARDNCVNAALKHNVTYLILGKDGEGYMNEYGQIWYRYLLDQTSVIHLWTSKISKLKDSESKQLQRDMFHVTKLLKEKGCDM